MEILSNGNPLIVVSKSIVLLKFTPKIDDNNKSPLIINLSLYLDIDILLSNASNIKLWIKYLLGILVADAKLDTFAFKLSYF